LAPDSKAQIEVRGASSVGAALWTCLIEIVILGARCVKSIVNTILFGPLNGQ
jgi:hypothetical protein